MTRGTWDAAAEELRALKAATRVRPSDHALEMLREAQRQMRYGACTRDEKIEAEGLRILIEMAEKLKGMSVTLLAGRKSYGDLERENAALKNKLAACRRAALENRAGDILRLTIPERVTAPIAPVGGCA